MKARLGSSGSVLRGHVGPCPGRDMRLSARDNPVVQVAGIRARTGNPRAMPASIVIQMVKLERDVIPINYFSLFSTMKRELNGRLAAPIALGEGVIMPAMALTPIRLLSRFSQMAPQMSCGA